MGAGGVRRRRRQRLLLPADVAGLVRERHRRRCRSGPTARRGSPTTGRGSTPAPGVDIISTFFDLTDEPTTTASDFDGWACWSGTSFSAPIVAAEIAWEWMTRGTEGAVGATATWMLQRKALYRHPYLGTVINVC